jgi:hypothetical protein
MRSRGTPCLPPSSNGAAGNSLNPSGWRSKLARVRFGGWPSFAFCMPHHARGCTAGSESTQTRTLLLIFKRNLRPHPASNYPLPRRRFASYPTLSSRAEPERPKDGHAESRDPMPAAIQQRPSEEFSQPLPHLSAKRFLLRSSKDAAKSLDFEQHESPALRHRQSWGSRFCGSVGRKTNGKVGQPPGARDL